MKNSIFERRCRYSIRKLSVGACSLMIGSFLFASPVLANQVEIANQEASVALAHPTGEQKEDETVRDNQVLAETSPETVAKEEVPALEKTAPQDSVQVTKEAVAEQASSVVSPQVTLEEKKAEAPVAVKEEANISGEALAKVESKTSENQAVKEEDTISEVTSTTKEAGISVQGREREATPSKVLSDVPEKTETSLKPKEIKFDTWKELLAWQPGERTDDAINRASVALKERHQGHVINEKASTKAKVQALSNTNSKAKDHASVGGEEFKAYAFDYWQYLDSMVFWEGLVPTPDVIDSAHRNGVPVYGTLFYNWGDNLKDQERLLESLQQDENGHYPVARKLVDLAHYYGYDGYFINEETDGELVDGKGIQMREFMLDAKKYAAEKGIDFKWSWYDALSYGGGRYHMDGVGKWNKEYLQGEDGQVPADFFFANFNWNQDKNDATIDWTEYVGRSPFDVMAGLELQKGGSYNTKVNWDALFDENGKLRLSLGLFAPDTITGMGKTGDAYHDHENIFWTGYQGDPSKQKPKDKDWYGIANLIADRTPIVGSTFSTSFNTGHGKKWFVDGKVAKDSEWNYRSVAGVLPTWRWWGRSNKERLQAGYDFDDAYNGGTSLSFKGNLAAKTIQDVNLYSTKIEVKEGSKLKVAHRGGKGADVYIAVSTSKDYSYDDLNNWKKLEVSDDWTVNSFDLSELSGKTIYGIKLAFANSEKADGYHFNLGELSISDQNQAPAKPQELQVLAQKLQNAQEAEAVLRFKGDQAADYYEVYAKNGDEWKLLTGSSNTNIYVPNLSRDANQKGTKQTLKVVTVGKNGLRSEGTLVDFDWGMTVEDTTKPAAAAENVVLGAQVLNSTFRDGGSESIDGMLTGTITSLSDKWSSDQLSGSVDIRLTKPRTIKRWVMDHAGAGGESVNDGLMNTKDFDLYYKDQDGQWKLAKSIRDNSEHVTDVTLDQAITAQDWRLDVLVSDNGTPWKAIRIYNWKMYESEDLESPNIPMDQVSARSLDQAHVQLGFKDVPAGATIHVYSDAKAEHEIAQLTATDAGALSSLPLSFAQKPARLYYRTALKGKELSNILTVAVPEAQKVIQSVTLESAPEKVLYRTGDILNLSDGLVRIRYAGDREDELIHLSNPAISVSGYDAQKLGEQVLHFSYLGHEIASPVTIRVASEAEMGPKKVVQLDLLKQPKVSYVVGEDLNLSKGLFKVRYDDGSVERHSLDEIKDSLTGYDKNQFGRQKVSLSFKDQPIELDVIVSLPPALNDEYLRQRLEEARHSLKKPVYTFASKEAKQQFKDAVKASVTLLGSEDITQEAINKALNDLSQAISSLDGGTLYKQEEEQLQALVTETSQLIEKHPSHKLATQLSTLLSEAKEVLAKEGVTPKEFKTSIEALKAQLAVFKENPDAQQEDERTELRKVVSLDAGRKYFSVAQIKELVDQLAQYGYTDLQLALGNDALRFLLDDMAIDGYSSQAVKEALQKGNNSYYNDPNGNFLTQDEMNEVIRYAKEKNIGIIPVIDSPGHMDAILHAMEELGIENPSFTYGDKTSKRTVNLYSDQAISFTKQLIEKYASYFSGKTDIFNIGLDEYANDVFDSPGWSQLQAYKKWPDADWLPQKGYDKFLTYANDLAAIVKKYQLKPMAFNDGIYYNEDSSFGEFDKDIIVSYWTAGWSGFDVASPDYLAQKGHTIFNTNDAWYFVLGRYNANQGYYNLNQGLDGIQKTPLANVPKANGKEIPIAGSVIGIWADKPELHYSKLHVAKLLKAFADKNAPYFKADYSGLLKEEAVLPSDLSLYTESSVKKLKAVLADVEALVKDSTRTQQGEIDSLTQRLKEARLQLKAIDSEQVQPQVDESLAKKRVVSLDAGRKYFAASQIKELIDQLATYGYTDLHLALGNEGLRFLLDDLSLTVNGKEYASDAVKKALQAGNDAYYKDPNGNALTKAEMDDILAYAKSKHIGVIPVINSPGHMDAILVAMKELGIQDANFNYFGEKESARTVDLENAEAVAFTKALIKKYAQYFSGKVEIFNIGSDEYANDAIGEPGWSALQAYKKWPGYGFPEKGYDRFVTYVNDLAAIVKEQGLKPMAFNDGIYYEEDSSYGQFDKDIIISYWTGGWSGFNVASPAYLADKGHAILNTNDAWYYVLGHEDKGLYNLDKALANMGKTPIRSVPKAEGVEIPTIGSMVAIWADDPSATYDVSRVTDLLKTFADKNANFFPGNASILEKELAKLPKDLTRYTTDSVRALENVLDQLVLTPKRAQEMEPLLSALELKAALLDLKEKQTRVDVIAVPYRTVERKDDTLPQGERRLVQAGSLGREVLVGLIDVVDGKEVVRFLGKEVQAQAVDEIVLVGTKVAQAQVQPDNNSQDSSRGESPVEEPVTPTQPNSEPSGESTPPTDAVSSQEPTVVVTPISLSEGRNGQTNPASVSEATSSAQSPASQAAISADSKKAEEKTSRKETGETASAPKENKSATPSDKKTDEAASAQVASQAETGTSSNLLPIFALLGLGALSYLLYVAVALGKKKEKKD
ncbi:endo-beta-N-acetylglucosaminidase [Streptococcus mitis]|uniref:endo-beta-N-acetylglucosaminidase n=1 Tax=Streptococcus mitis TaxID=28037 RepID=UPI001CC0EF42|nr:family 20 glycosylhydrolase [Streptococcus mitis]MBZ2106778.1 family 20 glycosylhydrolase [Streptococcus mitis]MBZ2114134.1 family 20 glycosylhydrolase [Streptococcus mitis]